MNMRNKWPTKKLGKALFKMLPHREWTREIRIKIKSDRISYNKNLVALASSAILLTFTIIQILSSDFYAVMTLKASWILFGISVISGVIAHGLIIHEDIFWLVGMRNIKDGRTVEDLLREEKEKFFDNVFTSIGFAKLGYYFDLGQIFSFLSAIICLVVFIILNF